MLMQTLALVALLPIGTAAGSCSELPTLLLEVQAKHKGVAVATDLSLAEIRDLWRRSGSPGIYEPFGFYTGGFTSAVRVDVPDPGACPAQVRIIVSMLLTNRQIEIGRELLANPCLYTAAVAHYRLLAATDDTLFSAFSARMRVSIPNELRVHTAGALPTGIEGRSRIEETIKSALDSGYKSYQANLAVARDQVDAPGELRNLQACGSYTRN